MGDGTENVTAIRPLPRHDAPDVMPLTHNPEKVLELAQRAASALKGVISKKDRPVIINGEQYLEFEDWQTLGQFYGCTVKTYDAERVEVEGVEGAKAKADLLDTMGRVIGGAEAYCFRNEEKGATRPWEDKPWFQLASMAQTRAGAKALRNRLAWVVVLAGYKPTPAEEMTGGEQGRVSAIPGRCPFKKYKDVPWADVPTDYLQWCLDGMSNLKPETRDIITQELQRRTSERTKTDALSAFSLDLDQCKTQAEAKTKWEAFEKRTDISDDQRSEGAARYNVRYHELKEPKR